MIARRRASQQHGVERRGPVHRAPVCARPLETNAMVVAQVWRDRHARPGKPGPAAAGRRCVRPE